MPNDSMPAQEEVGDALFQVLIHNGVECLFCVPGAALTPVEFAADRNNVRILATKHETGAAFMAMGFAQAGRRLGVCAVTTGPSATNAVTGIAAARADSVPVMLLTGQVPTRNFGAGAFQDSSPLGELDVTALLGHVTKRSVLLMDASQVRDITHGLVREALAGRKGPVHLSVPMNLATETVTTSPRRPVTVHSAPPAPDETVVHAIARALTEARRPAVLAGHGVHLAEGFTALRQVAERFEVPVATTPKGKGAFPENHPMSLGVFGFGGPQPAESYLMDEQVDVLLVVGSSLGEYQTHNFDPALGAGRKVIQIDIEHGVIGRRYPVDIAVVADARSALEALAKVGVAGREPIRRFWEPPAPGVERESTPSELLSPRAAVAAMSESLPPDALFFCDIGNCMSWASECHQVREPGTYFVGLGLGSMGYAGPAAIGAKLAAPDRPVVALMGDGAFAMTGMEIHTAVVHELPVVWVVLNNRGFAMCHTGVVTLNGEPVPWHLYDQQLDIATIARGLGARAYTARTESQVRSTVTDALRAGTPAVIDVRVDPEEVSALVQYRADAVRSAMTR